MSEDTAELLRLLSVDCLPVEYWVTVTGKACWHWPSNHEPLAVITYAHEPSPETGDEGWCWWALGEMGEAPTYEQAKARAEDALRKMGGK